MVEFEEIAKKIKECNTKSKWEDFFQTYSGELSVSNNSKHIADIYTRLKSDPQSLDYDPQIFSTLIKGCLSCWNLELGREICEFANTLTIPLVAIPATRLFMESGLPHLARQTAQKALRRKNVKDKDRLQLEMLVCSSFAELGKHKKAIKMLADLKEDAKSADLKPTELADLNVEIGRMLFFLGQYHEAGEGFEKASKIYLNMEDWESAARSLFNTAMCYHNIGEKLEEGFALVEEVRKIADTHNFPGPLSHIEAFYGVDAFYHGNFSEARDHFRRALAVIPSSDNGYRKLHVISMLAFIYLLQGRYKLAKQVGKQTLELAALDESNKYQMRYLCLEAELKWEEGRIVESQEMLTQAVNKFKESSIHTLEELSAYSRYLLQAALLNEPQIEDKITVNQGLRKNSFTWLDHLMSKGQISLSQQKFSDAKTMFLDIEIQSHANSDRYHEAVSLLGQTEAMLGGRKVTEELKQKNNQFQIAVARLGDTPLRARAQFINASISYMNGDFDTCIGILRSASKSNKISFADKFVLNCWLDTSDGRSSRLTQKWQLDLLARFTKLYFSPNVEVINKSLFRISGHYMVTLERHPSLSEMLYFLLQKRKCKATMEEIQTDVWKQNLKMLGWQQKIRNAIMRIRNLFPYTMAPLLLHHEDVFLFSAAIDLLPETRDEPNRNAEIIKILSSQPLTSAQLSDRLALSPATVKRTLQKMTKDNELEIAKVGRNVYYGTKTSTFPPLPL
ncbi:MAG: hypothetical protein R3B45_09465 [Bdellovibrionota bacterium]